MRVPKIFHAVTVPVSVFAAGELAAVLHLARFERPYIARAAAVASLVEVALAVLAGLALAVWSRRWPEARSDAALLPVASGTVLAACVLFLLANDQMPLALEAPPRGVSALALAAGIGVAAGWARRLFRGGRGGPGALLCGPVALAGGYFVACWIVRDFGSGLSTIARICLTSASILGSAAAGYAAGHLRAWSRLRSASWSPLMAPAAVAAAACTLLASSHTPFPAASPRAPGAPDVLLVVLDTVRGDRAPAPRGARFATPALARLAAEGVRFTRAFATSCWTLPSHASLFTGLSPLEHHTGWESPKLPESVVTLAETFKERGYRTAAFSANIWITPEFGFDQGFDRFVVPLHKRPPIPWIWGIAPDAVPGWDALLPFHDKGGFVLASEATASLGASDPRPAFVFVNLLEAHLPYAPPARYATPPALRAIDQTPLRGLLPSTAPTAREIEGMRLLYEASVAYDDDLLGRLVDTLRRAGRLDRTVVAVTSDHGENLGEHPPLDHQFGLWDSLVHVPLVVRYPAGLAAAERDDLVSLVDVREALLRLSGPGASWDPPPRDAVFFAYDRPLEQLERIRHRLGIDPAPWDRRLHGVRTASAKWIEASDGTRWAFDLDRDPLEAATPLPPGTAVPAGAVELEARLRAWIAAAATRPAAQGPDASMSDETRRRLRSLGYVH